MNIRPAQDSDAKRISELILSLSHMFTLSPDGAGAEQFFTTVGEEAIRRHIAADNVVYLVAEHGDNSDLAGLVAMRDHRHLNHLFVAASLQGRGLGRRLWEAVRNLALIAGNPGEFTVNASPNAVAVYERFGFVRAGDRIEARGIAYFPMRLG